MEKITSKENQLFKKLMKLKMKKYREKEGMFLAEGRKFLYFLESPELIILKDEISDTYSELVNKFECKKIVLEGKLFKELSSQENSQGIIVVYPIKKRNLVLNQDIVILNNISDPGNLGTILRIVDAVGLKNVILTKGSVDCYNEKVVRSSMGSILTLNILYMEEEILIELLKREGYKIFATSLRKDSIEYTDMNLEEKNAYIFGNEGNGVSDELIDIADEKVIIPIEGTAESLNVSIATAIILYEMRRIKRGL